MAQRGRGMGVGVSVLILIKLLLNRVRILQISQANTSLTRAINTFSNGIKTWGLRSSS
jgi:hypothetical protein